MAVDGISPALAIRSGAGVELWSSTGLKSPFEPDQRFPRDETKSCRSMVFSPDGRYFAYTNGNVVKVITTFDWKEKCSLPRPKAFHLKFSPLGNYLVTWELYSVTKEKPEGAPNMYVYKSDSGEEAFSIVQKKQTDWEPCWSSDETLFAMMVGGEAFFYELNTSKGFKSSAKKLGGGRGGVLSLAPGNCPPHIAFYVPGGAKGSPSMCKIYKYPSLQQNQTVACKSFFQADHVEMMWNKRGTGLLLLTTTEIDQTGASYYGKQALHFLSTKGDSYAVQLGKEGPIHAVSWSPKGTEFLVVYGYMPSKATLFNLKCDVVFNFGEGSRNCAYFNGFGNLLILAGFGNLRGYVEIWDVNKKSQITSTQASDSTFLDWSPTGETFITATTSPRLRIGNGFKVWHYSGALLHETLWPQGQELLEVCWQKFPDGVFIENPISSVKIEGIKSSQPEASKQVYQPPNVRLMKEGKLPGNGDSIPQPTIPGLPPGYTSQKSVSNSNRQRKPRNRREKNSENSNNKTSPKNEESQTNSTVPTEIYSNESQVQIQSNQHHSKSGQQKPRRTSRTDKNYIPTGDPEKDKKIRNIQKKLQDISKLKSKKNKGEFLEANQLTKIESETTLIEELKALKVSS